MTDLVKSTMWMLEFGTPTLDDHFFNVFVMRRFIYLDGQTSTLDSLKFKLMMCHCFAYSTVSTYQEASLRSAQNLSQVVSRTTEIKKW